jgi:hypothetical protein
MAKYSISTVQYLEDHSVSVTITGPGIKPAGVEYWFQTLQEAHSFVENLNLSHWYSKLLSQTRIRRVPQNRRSRMSRGIAHAGVEKITR